MVNITVLLPDLPRYTKNVEKYPVLRYSTALLRLYALVVQRTGRKLAELKIEVRFLSRAPRKIVET